MTLDEFRLQMESYRRKADDEAKSLKDTHTALDRLRVLYQRLNDEEKRMADTILAEWALSEDENARFDALALINDFRIATAISGLQKLAERLAMSIAPSAPYELKKVRRILEKLGVS